MQNCIMSIVYTLEILHSFHKPLVYIFIKYVFIPLGKPQTGLIGGPYAICMYILYLSSKLEYSRLIQHTDQLVKRSDCETI